MYTRTRMAAHPPLPGGASGDQLQPATARSQTSCTVAPSQLLRRACGDGRLAMPNGGSHGGIQWSYAVEQDQASREPDVAGDGSRHRRRVRQDEHE